MLEEDGFNIDVEFEANRFFDDSSIAQGSGPRIVLIMGGPAAGKTTMRKQRYSKGYVLIDASEIFLNLSRGAYYPFPDAFEEQMNIIGSLIAQRAIGERRNIVTELIGADQEATIGLIEAVKAAGYRTELQAITCDIDEAMRRNDARDDDSISAYYTEPYQRRWIMEAIQAAGSKGV